MLVALLLSLMCAFAAPSSSTTLRAARVAPYFPEPEFVSSGAELVTKTEAFLDNLPSGYEFQTAFTEDSMIAVVLRPSYDILPYVVTAAATDRILEQSRRALSFPTDRLVNWLLDRGSRDAFGRPTRPRRLIVTGYGAGALVARGLAHDLNRIVPTDLVVADELRAELDNPTDLTRYLRTQVVVPTPLRPPNPARVLETLSEAALILELQNSNSQKTLVARRFLISLIYAREKRLESEPAWAEHVFGLRQLRLRLSALIAERS